jgi:lactoylglutathione lyase
MDARLNQVIVYVSDMSRSVTFYRDVLGLPLHSASEHWSQFSTGEVTLALHLSRTSESASGSADLPAGRVELSLEVPNVELACEELQAKGVAVEGPKILENIELPVAFLRDPDGLAIVLAQKVL